MEYRFHGVGVARESLGDGRQAGVDSAGGDHHFVRWEGSAGELFLEVSAEGFFGGFSLRDSFIGFPQCGLAGGEDPGLQSGDGCHFVNVGCLRHSLRFRGVDVLGRR